MIMNAITTNDILDDVVQITSSAHQSIVSISNLNVFSKKEQILKNINIDIPKNKITVLLGPSGCGKTTLLKCLNRLTDLHSELKLQGSILIDGDDILNTKN